MTLEHTQNRNGDDEDDDVNKIMKTTAATAATTATKTNIKGENHAIIAVFLVINVWELRECIFVRIGMMPYAQLHITITKI